MHNYITYITKPDFFIAFYAAFYIAFSPKNIQGGF